ncbi:acetyl-CoA synthetase-like protein [Polychaeton citri CBS 116435]|uniref:Acetyl-CoA synthetase-like protein n=1 Tax=Polychaeton citri CBS 116435 TaxID=1314669 RepID=A0A9P4UU36_9PEZI|nr:acetyl-CoA synthetase-like protein [Polychaeton citri CBS 116435]
MFTRSFCLLPRRGRAFSIPIPTKAQLVASGTPRLSHLRTTISRCSLRTLLTASHAQGPTSPPLIEETIPDHFASIVSQHASRPAVHVYDRRLTLTYGQLDSASNALARGFQDRLGVRKGDRVSVMLGNNAPYAVITYALFKLGAVLVPLNPSFNERQVMSALNMLGVKTFVVSMETKLSRKKPRWNGGLARTLMGDTMEGTNDCSQAVPTLENIVLVDNVHGEAAVKEEIHGCVGFEELSKGYSDAALPDQGLDKDDIANIQFTSGTTSMPKAACLTHRNILNNGIQIGDRMLLTPDDVIVCPPPLFHCFGCILGYMATATHGSSIVFPSETFDPLQSLKAVQTYNATGLYGVATMFLAELDLLDNGTVAHQGFDRLRTGIAAGSSVPAELMRKLYQKLNLTDLTICYGMTETSPVSCMTATDDPLDKRINTVGRLLPHVEAKVVDIQDHSRILPLHERGELAVSGYLVMRGYWNDEVKTREAFLPDPEVEGKVWMLTGDEATMDAEGYVKITGRIKDLIIRGGENIHPLEVENCLLSNAKISNVSVVGLPDERYGEVVAAFVVRGESGRKEGEFLAAEEVRSWVRERLSGHLVPKHVFWVEDFPKTASGKVQKFKLREDGIEMLKQEKGQE